MPRSGNKSNSFFMKRSHFRASADLGVGDEAGRMRLHQAVQPGLLGPVTLVVGRRVIRHPLAGSFASRAFSVG